MTLNRLRDGIIFILAVCAFVVLCPPLETFLNDADNCSPLAFIENIRGGEIIYKDFIVQFPPGIYYAAYMVMQVFNNNFIGYIILVSLGNALVSWLVFKIAAELFGTTEGIVSFALSIVLHPPLYKWYLCAFPLASLYFYMLYLNADKGSGPRLPKLMLSAFSAGLGLYFRLDTAVYVVVAILAGQVAGLFSCGNIARHGLTSDLEGKRAFFLKHSLLFLVCFGLTIVPFFLFAIWYDALPGVWQSVVVLTASAPGALALPYPSLYSIPQGFATLIESGDVTKIHVVLYFLIPLAYLIYALSAAGTIIFGEMRDDPWKSLQRVPVAVFGCLLFLQAMHRSDFWHLLQAATVFWIIVPGMLTSALEKHSRLWILICWTCLAVILYSAAAMDVRKKAALQSDISGKLKEYLSGVESLPDHTVSKLVKYIQAHSNPKDRLLVSSHSVQIYYFSHRRFAGGLMYYQPWNELVYANVLQRLREQKPKIDLVVSLADFKFDGMEERSLKVFAPKVYDFIVGNFCCAAAIGDYVVFRPLPPGGKCSDALECRF